MNGNILICLGCALKKCWDVTRKIENTSRQVFIAKNWSLIWKVAVLGQHVCGFGPSAICWNETWTIKIVCFCYCCNDFGKTRKSPPCFHTIPHFSRSSWKKSAVSLIKWLQQNLLQKIHWRSGVQDFRKNAWAGSKMIKYQKLCDWDEISSF